MAEILELKRYDWKIWISKYEMEKERLKTSYENWIIIYKFINHDYESDT